MDLPTNSRVVFLGDSLTFHGADKSYGYIAVMKKWLAANLPARNLMLYGAGVKGNDVREMQARFTRDVTPKAPTHVVVFTGRNDVGNYITKPADVPLALFESTLLDVVQRIRNINAVPILATLAVAGECHDGTNPLDPRLDEYAAKQIEIAETVECEIVDVREAFLAYLRKYNLLNVSKGILTSDATHPNALGHSLLADLFLTALVNRQT